MAPRPRSRGRFWEGGGGSGDRLERAAAESERWELLLRRGELLALGGHLKGALEAYAAALRRGAPVRPECLGTLVDCLVLNYRLRHGLGWSAARAADAGAGGLLSCLGCRGFLSEPVTVPCGHSYCRRCLRRELRARCRLCRDRLPPAAAAADAEGTPPRPPPLAAAIAASGFRTSVVLNHLAEKWFPSQQERARAAGRLGELLHQGRHREALAASGEALRAGDGAGRHGPGRPHPPSPTGWLPGARLRPREAPRLPRGLRFPGGGSRGPRGCGRGRRPEVLWSQWGSPSEPTVTRRGEGRTGAGFPWPRPGAGACASRERRGRGPGPGGRDRGGEWGGRAALLFLPPRSFRELAARPRGTRRGETAAGAGRGSPAEAGRAAFTLVSHKSHRGNCKPREGRIA